MAVSPLERDTTLRIADQQQSTVSSNPRPPIIIHRGPHSFGFTLRAVKVFHGNTDYYTTQHVVVAAEGPAEKAGLRANDMITHVNEQPVAGLFHSDVVKLILNGSLTLSIRTIPYAETQIRTGGRRRSPSKQKLRYQQHPCSGQHQPNCHKYRLNSSGNSSNKKYPQNNSLFRRLSERKVARDIEAAVAAAAGGAPSPAPTTGMHASPTSTANNSTVLSSSLPFLPSNPPSAKEKKEPSSPKSVHPPDEFLSASNTPSPKSLPSIAKTNPQVTI